MIKFVTYILRSEKNGRYYVGHTSDMSERLLYHNTGKVAATKNKGPWTIAYIEEYESKLKTNQRELEIKSKKTKRYIEYLIEMRKLLSW